MNHPNATEVVTRILPTRNGNTLDIYKERIGDIDTDPTYKEWKLDMMLR